MQALPVIQIEGETLPEVWERSIVRLMECGTFVPTEYDKPGAPASRDALAVLTVRRPFTQPRIHRALPMGLAELFVYVEEVVHGVHDHWIDPDAGKWEYTYHERLRRYIDSIHEYEDRAEPCLSGVAMTAIDQLDYIVEALAQAPHSRRAQAITWQPAADTVCTDPPCLQRIWCRILDDELVMNVHMRSNDAYKAAFSNMYAFTAIQAELAAELSSRLGRSITPGQYNHIADSYHIYGAYYEEVDAFLAGLGARSFAERTYREDDPGVQELFTEAAERLSASLEAERETGRKGL
jgi:thymidylate synthase